VIAPLGRNRAGKGSHYHLAVLARDGVERAVPCRSIAAIPAFIVWKSGFTLVSKAASKVSPGHGPCVARRPR